jgi:hypothetical protein
MNEAYMEALEQSDLDYGESVYVEELGMFILPDGTLIEDLEDE